MIIFFNQRIIICLAEDLTLQVDNKSYIKIYLHLQKLDDILVSNLSLIVL